MTNSTANRDGRSLQAISYENLVGKEDVGPMLATKQLKIAGRRRLPLGRDT